MSKKDKSLKSHTFVSLCLDIELLSKASCLTLYTSSNWSSKEELSLSLETEISFQGQIEGGKGLGSPVSTHLPLMYPRSNSPRTKGIPILLMSWSWLSHRNPQDFYQPCLLLCRTAITLLSYINQYPHDIATACSSTANTRCPKFTLQILKVIHNDIELF